MLTYTLCVLGGLVVGYVIGHLRGYNAAAQFIGDRVGRKPGEPWFEYPHDKKAEGVSEGIGGDGHNTEGGKQAAGH